ncbi:hypothetical protein MBH78_17410 [Oceanimonas sp. NS1]|nr:hypothetical protein [Oceanimonas sp. NS1]
MFELLGWSLLAGVVNALAGGGLFFTLPALLGTGIPSTAAVATASVASWPGYVSAFGDASSSAGRPAAGVDHHWPGRRWSGRLCPDPVSCRPFHHLVPWLLLGVSLLYGRQLLSSQGFEGPLAMKPKAWPVLLGAVSTVAFLVAALGYC